MVSDKDNLSAEKKPENLSDGKDSEVIICPECKYASRKSDDPVFCLKCGFNFKTPNGSQRTQNLNVPPNTYIHNQIQMNTYPTPYGYPPMRGYPNQFMHPQMINPRIPPGSMPFMYRPQKTWSIGGGIGVMLLSLVGGAVISIIIMLILVLLDINYNSSSSTFLIGSSSLLFFFIPYLWVQRYYSKRLTFKERMEKIGLPLNKYSKAHFGRELLLGCLLGVVCIFLVIGLQYIAYILVYIFYGVDVFNLLAGSSMGSEYELTSPTALFDLLFFVGMIFLFVGVPEEVLFRGFIQRSFESKVNRAAATFLTAVLFALAHIYILIVLAILSLNAIYFILFFFLFIPYLGISLILGLVRNWRQDLFAAVALHIVYDIIQMIILYLILNPI